MIFARSISCIFLCVFLCTCNADKDTPQNLAHTSQGTLAQKNLVRIPEVPQPGTVTNCISEAADLCAVSNAVAWWSLTNGILGDAAACEALLLIAHLKTNRTLNAAEKLVWIDKHSLQLIGPVSNALFYLKTDNFWPCAARPALYVLLESIADDETHDALCRAEAYFKMSLIAKSCFDAADAIALAERAASLCDAQGEQGLAALSHYVIGTLYAQPDGDVGRSLAYLQRAESACPSTDATLLYAIRGTAAATLLYRSQLGEAERVIARMTPDQQEQTRGSLVYKWALQGKNTAPWYDGPSTGMETLPGIRKSYDELVSMWDESPVEFQKYIRFIFRTSCEQLRR